MALIRTQQPINTMNYTTYHTIHNIINPLIEVYFKLAWTTQTKMYMLDPNWTISNFKNIIKTKILTDFNVMQYELVDTMQRQIEGVDSEDMPALQSTNETLVSKYGPRLEVAFYIRPLPSIINVIPILYPEITTVPFTPAVLITRTIAENETCQLCHEPNQSNQRPTQYFGCSHVFCDECIAGCVENNHSLCPCCRHSS